MLTRWSERLGATGLALALAGPLVAHLRLAAPLVGFLGLALGLLLALLATVVGLAAVVRGPARGRAALALAPGLLVILGIAAALGRGGGGSHPRINDITTDVADPPAFVQAPMLPGNAGRDMAYPGEDFARQQTAGYPHLGPLALAVPPDEAFEQVRRAAHAMPGWEITREDAGARALEGVDTSWLFRFRDDFVIEVRANGASSVVHMRSKSRDGKGDLGANAARIRRFFARLTGRD